jgi:probable HAF family extracellular repeat protein
MYNALHRVLAGLVVTAVAAGSAWAQTAPYYSVRRVGYGSAFSTASSLNDAGDVAGVYRLSNGLTRVYVWRYSTGSASVPAGIAGGPYSTQRAAVINDFGQIAFTGTRFDDSGLISRAVILNSGVFAEVPPIEGQNSEVASINNAGHAAGRSEAGPASIRAYLFAGGETTDLGQIQPPFGNQFRAAGMNDLDSVVGVGDNASGGQSGFVWDGAMIDLGPLVPAAINDLGVVVGNVPVTGATRGFIRQPDGSVSIIGTLGGRDSALAAVNAAGDAVGNSQIADGSSAGLLVHNGELHNLNDILDRAARKSRAHVAAAYAINTLGWIVASDGSVPLLLIPTDDCAADFNGDGGIDGADVGAFFSSWERSDVLADVNNDGGVDGADIGDFFRMWESGGC